MFSQFETERIECLQEFSYQMLKYNSLTYLTWWNTFDGREGREVDLVLRLVMEKEQSLVFVDESRNQFFLRTSLEHLHPQFDCVCFFKQFDVVPMG